MNTMDWNTRIKLAERNGEFTKQDMNDAGNWVTCACGQQDPRIRRDSDGKPEDQRLFDLGAYFSQAVGGDQFNTARETLHAIERRSAKLLKLEAKS